MRFPQQGLERVADYILVNAKASYDFTPANSVWGGEFFLIVKNLTAEKYEHRPGYPMARITVHSGLKLEF